MMPPVPLRFSANRARISSLVRKRASASAIPGDDAHRAAYHLFRLTPDGNRLSIHLDVRGMAAPDAPVTLLDSETITP